MDICNINGGPVNTKTALQLFLWCLTDCYYCNAKLYMLDGIFVTLCLQSKLFNALHATIPFSYITLSLYSIIIINFNSNPDFKP